MLSYGYGYAHAVRGFSDGHQEVVEIIDVVEEKFNEYNGYTYTYYKTHGGIITGGDSGAGLFRMGADGKTKVYGLATQSYVENGILITHFTPLTGYQGLRDNLVENILQ